MQDQLDNFHQEVALKYSLYNSLFLTLPFGSTEETGMILPVFAKYSNAQIQQNQSPATIIQHFFAQHLNLLNEHDQNKAIVHMLQFIERQVLLFDALEDAAFTKTHDLNGTGTLSNFLAKVKDAHRKTDLLNQLKDYQITVVLTAHPTQFYPSPILGIITQLIPALQQNDLKTITQLLIQLGKTSFKHSKKPTPLQEAQGLTWYLKHVFYKAIPDILQNIKKSLALEESQVKLLYKCVTLGFWPGGDRDGNPYVTHETTLAVVQLLKSSILDLYLHDLKKLSQKLTFPGVLENLLAILKKTERTYLTTQISITTQVTQSKRYPDAQSLLDDLNALRTLLVNQHNSLFLEDLDEFIVKVQCFEFYFATLDMRQDAQVLHVAFMTALSILSTQQPNKFKVINSKNYDHLTTTEKLTLLTNLIQEKINFSFMDIKDNPLSLETWKSLAIIPQIQQSNGQNSLHRYIISNTSSACDVLELLAMLHLTRCFPNMVSVDIIPLFESIRDLEQAQIIMEQLYQCDVYVKHLKNRSQTQTIMLGFSDGTKDGGYVAANWSIYKAKMHLTTLSRKYGIHVVFFDGRGGPPARGGGNTHQFYRSLGNRICHKQSELTVQGQTISANFGTYPSAKFNLEQLFTAGLEDLVFPEKVDNLNATEIALLEKLSAASLSAYLKLKNHSLFIPYIEQVTPIRFYSELNIGSRPTRRKKTPHLQLSNLRAIPFVGSWSQLKQNVPGFYGFGTALKTLIDQGQEDELAKLYQSSLFFRTLVENAMMSLSKSFFPLTAYLKKDAQFGQFWKILETEATLTKQMLLKISKQSQLLENEPVNRASIALRAEIIFPLLIIQQFALIKLREEELETLPIYKKMVLKALAANTNASRNSA